MDPYPISDVIDLTNLADSFTDGSQTQHNPDEVIELDRDSEDSIYNDRSLSDNVQFGEENTMEELMNLEIYKNPKERAAKLRKSVSKRGIQHALRLERLKNLEEASKRLEQEMDKEKAKNIKRAVRERLRAMRDKREKCTVCNNLPKETTFGSCPICWEELGDEPMASTTCGHVFCIECIRRYLNHDPKCPTCRHELVGPNVYHPLYLSQGT
ncbi:unnamed protein product [Spodoptera littoralis]|uniref:RING-type domain-containing protein n=1 Tax=Spodoptera littoralis TaxID=7109 RepID=A0A9P0I3X1_SPOLI|nr:unnamed protein product [Spodoptera littoralis]